MSGYGAFGRFYDQFTQNVNYPERAAYLHQLFAYYGVLPRRVLDLACGTGSLTVELSKLGYEMLGTDASAEMLAAASAKCSKFGEEVQFFLQPMEDLILPKPVDAVVCTLDSINHLPDEDALAEVFRAVYQNTTPKSYFIFDVNSLYKFETVLGDSDFIFEEPPLYLGWQNRYFAEEDIVEIKLDFFEEQPDSSYQRWEEYIEERYFSKSVLKAELEAAGFALLDVFGENSLTPPKLEEERFIYVAQRRS